MIKAGITDPLKVVRTALVDASGVASLLTTTECMIVDAPKKDAPPMPGTLVVCFVLFLASLEDLTAMRKP